MCVDLLLPEVHGRRVCGLVGDHLLEFLRKEKKKEISVLVREKH